MGRLSIFVDEIVEFSSAVLLSQRSGFDEEVWVVEVFRLIKDEVGIVSMFSTGIFFKYILGDTIQAGAIMVIFSHLSLSGSCESSL